MEIGTHKGEERREIDTQISSVNKFASIITVVWVLAAVVTYLTTMDYLSKMAHPIELIQAILVCSTALIALTGLMIIEAKKARVTGTMSNDGFERVNALNAFNSLVREYAFLRWSLFVSFITLLSGILYLIYDNKLFIAGALTAFILQLYFFVWASLFADFLPS
jgi:hypothetical protein